MNYIILDFEWDTVFYKPEKRFINQIVQIGAVKLNENLEFVGDFKVFIKSSFCKKVSRRFTELTGITTEEMLSGVSFAQAVKEYNDWTGDDIVTLTWSNSDLYTIVDNAKLFLNDGRCYKIGKYVDLQNYVQSELKLKGQEIKNQISLSLAAEMLGIETESFDIHNALDDSRLTAEILRKTFDAERFSGFVRDTDSADFFKRFLFRKTYISNQFDKRINKKWFEFNCDKCGKKAKPKNEKWKYNNHWFCNEFVCENCQNVFLGRVMLKVTYSGIKVTKRRMRPENPEKSEVKEK